ncbi:hypothetical protein AB0B63_18575 [Micromonospora sp. NPDC049081]|uniref:hypothetical protein n=1 Tax=Micromonospora sp. NPDC049081 TaxID=3155150 RepID=UPI0033CF59A7
MSAPANATDVARQLAKLSLDLDATVEQLEVADRDATEKRAASELAFSRAFMSAEGSVETRKHLAVIATHDIRLETEVADALVRHLRRRVDAIKTRIEVGRSYGAAIRAEVALAGSGMTP